VSAPWAGPGDESADGAVAASAGQNGYGPTGVAQGGVDHNGVAHNGLTQNGVAQNRSPAAPGTRPLGAPGTVGLRPGPNPGTGGIGGAQQRPAAKHGRGGFTGSIPLTGGITLTGGISLTGITLRRARPGKSKKQTVSGFDPVVRGRGLARLSRRPQPTTASELQRACVRWVVTLWLMVVLLQRFQLPNQEIALLLPLSLAWCVYGLVRGVLEIDRHRFGWWLGAAGISALMVPVQYALVPQPIISMTSWGLLLVTWLVFVFRLRDRRRSTYLQVLRGVVRISLWQAGLVIVFLVSQLVLPYQDWVAKVIPANILLQHYTLAYPFSYGSSYYRSNGWIGLETSFTSIQLALGVIAALLLRRKLPVLLFMLAAIACTGAQSGLPMIAAAFGIILFSQSRWSLARYAVMVPAVIAFLISPLGANTLTRLTEGTGSNTSTGQRSTVPYTLLWPEWIKESTWVLLGRGPGSSQTLVENSHVTGVLVPSPIKLFFDYGVIAGLALAVFFMFMYLGGPSRAYALAMASAYWVFQPGTTTILLVITIPLFITWWTPRDYKMLESENVPSPNATIVPSPRGRPRVEVPT
jgi:hypothetical protein